MNARNPRWIAGSSLAPKATDRYVPPATMIEPLEPRVLLSVTPASGVTASWGAQGLNPADSVSELNTIADALVDIGLGFGRAGVKFGQFYDNGQPNPQTLDGRIEPMLTRGVRPFVLFDYYDDEPNEITDYDWYQIGYEFAQRFQPDSAYLQSQGIYGVGVEHWAAFNEPDIQSHWDTSDNGTGFDPVEFGQAVEQFADGIHAADPDAQVITGGFAAFNYSGNWHGNGYLTPLVPLLNDGTLQGLNLHNYDAHATKTQRWPQQQFDRHKSENGITADIDYYNDEFNRSDVSTDQDDEFLTQIWTNSGVVGAGGNDSPVKTGFAMAFKATAVRTPTWGWGLADSLGPWTPNSRGEVLERAAELAHGMDYLAARPYSMGYDILAGGGKKMWVWHNREVLSQFAGDRVRIMGVPADATALEVHTHLGLERTVATNGATEIELHGLPTDQTLMIVADSDSDLSTAGLDHLVAEPGKTVVLAGDVDGMLDFDPATEGAAAVADAQWYTDADAKWFNDLWGFDGPAGQNNTRIWTMDFAPGAITGATLELAVRSDWSNVTGALSNTRLFIDGTDNASDSWSLADLNFRAVQHHPLTNTVDLAALGVLDRLADGRLNLALANDVGLDYARLILTYDQPIGDVIGESGTVTVSQADAGTWHTVLLDNNYTDPVIVTGPISFNDSDAATLRVRNVTADRFEFQIDEWDYQDGGHGSESVSYLVVEAGRHVMPDGSVIEAGSYQDLKHTFKTVNFSQPFAAAPIVLSQITTVNEPSAATTRQKDVTTDSFRVRVQEEEANDGVRSGEDVGWIAISTGQGSLGGRAFEAGNTGLAVDENWEAIGFNAVFSQTPGLLAGVQTFSGQDPVVTRYRNLTTTGVETFIQEEQSANAETGHNNEAIGYLLLEPGTLSLGQPLNYQDDFDDGTADGFTAVSGAWQVDETQRYVGERLEGGNRWGITTLDPGSPLSADFDFSATINSPEVGAFENAFFVFDYVDENNFKFAGAYIGGNHWAIGEVVGGSRTKLTTVSDTIQKGQDYLMMLEVRGNTVSLRVDGAAVLSYSFASVVNAGLVGLAVENAQASFDDLVLAEVLPWL